MKKKFLNWEECDLKWENMNYIWEDVSIFIEIDKIVKGGGGYADYVKGNPWDKLKKDIGNDNAKRVIKLYCNYKGIEYNEIVENNNNNINVTAKDFEFFITENIREGIKIKVSF
jgi:hypothetical protein